MDAKLFAGYCSEDCMNGICKLIINLKYRYNMIVMNFEFRIG